MANRELNAEFLLNLGFVDVGRWQPNGGYIAYHLDGEDAAANEVLLDARNALYAFVKGDQVLYIGKTARSIRKRYVGYCRPGIRQATNQRCHRNIKTSIEQGTEIRIFAFAPITHLRYADFEINLAAGLEDSLIGEFQPPWNGKDKDQPITEDAEREEAEESEVEAPAAPPASDIQQEPKASSPAPASFSITLGQTYYNKGFLNPGVEVSRFLGKDGDPIRVLLGDTSNIVISKINRAANSSGAVRVVGSNQQIARWFQDNFREGDTVHGRVIDPHTIKLIAGKTS
ncbi:GIY-YIG nuclease family protein [Mesorhizobium sp. B2-8-5]|uniref:GIY-YIG nuclease family protein n=1 Tax=Mesorhizobium sp. B2-8-5 TaxID=2589903 RepID=UPI001D02AFA2|nr:GIY-YIG nuclease family protein [Mesorhizobium sp. B2-8-5]UCI23966.1 GIY-YIG nuclease family protein [Mesorhizobium sp. B2-8-5]